LKYLANHRTQRKATYHWLALWECCPYIFTPLGFGSPVLVTYRNLLEEQWLLGLYKCHLMTPSDRRF